MMPETSMYMVVTHCARPAVTLNSFMSEGSAGAITVWLNSETNAPSVITPTMITALFSTFGLAFASVIHSSFRSY